MRHLSLQTPCTILLAGLTVLWLTACSKDSDELLNIQRDVTLGAWGGHQSFSLSELRTEVTTVEGQPDWISGLSLSMTGAGPGVDFDVADNLSTAGRSCKLVFRNEPGDQYSLLVTQGALSDTTDGLTDTQSDQPAYSRTHNTTTQ